MKQVELAQRLGISKSYLSMILSGQRVPKQELAERISSQLSCLESLSHPVHKGQANVPLKVITTP
ncbi:helix-turn-helix domain-containing protein [Chloroflexota bacterium]